MGSNSASAGSSEDREERKVDTYSDQYNKIQKRKKFRTPATALLEGVMKPINEKAKAANLKRRKAFIKKQGLTGDDINMSDDYLSSSAGLAELKKQGYTTVVTTGNNDNGRNNNQVEQTTTMATATAPTTAEVSQSSATDASTVDTDNPTYLKRKNKRIGRSLTILTSSSVRS